MWKLSETKGFSEDAKKLNITVRFLLCEVGLDPSGLTMSATSQNIVCIRKGELHLTESVCPRDFLGELEYWGLSALHLGQQPKTI